MDNVFASTIGAVKCDHCSDWMLKEGLKETIMVRIVVVVEGSELTLTATKTTLASIVKDWTDEHLRLVFAKR